MGIEIDGIDLSELMLSLLEAKVKTSKVRTQMHQGDMRSFKLEKAYKLITILFRALFCSAFKVEIWPPVERETGPKLATKMATLISETHSISTHSTYSTFGHGANQTNSWVGNCGEFFSRS